MQVDFMDIRKQDSDISEGIETAIKKVINSTSFILGKEVKNFEDEFAKYCSVKYAVGVGNGTEALHLALLALGVGTGDEVITTSNTYIATALAISFTGARPVFLDADPVTYNIDVAKIERAITKKTKALLPVHLYGQPADMDIILSIAKKRGLKVLEDAAQAHGAEYKGKKTGGLGDVAAFSFYPGKNLGAYGDGGIITTNDKNIYENLLLLRDYGRKSKYEHIIKGYNSRLDSMQAAVLSVKLKKLDKWNDARRENAAKYNGLFSSSNSDIITPKEMPYARHVYHQYVIRVPNRDKVVEEMKKRGVTLLVHYPIPAPLQEAYKDSGHKKGDFPVSEKLSEQVISLPIYPGLTKQEVEYVAQQFKEVVK